MLDLSQFDTVKHSDIGAHMGIRNPKTNEAVIGDDGTPWTIKLRGKDSEVAQKIIRASKNLRFKQAMDQNKRSELNADEFEKDSLDLLIACTMDWNGLILDGKKFEYSRDNARALYQRFPWIREQADRFIDDRTNFLGN